MIRTLLTRIRRRWIRWMYGSRRDLYARCRVCGEWFDWHSRDVTVPPMCPDCLARRSEDRRER
jgi:hypothetical protein